MRVNGDEIDIDDSDLQVDLNLSRNHIYHIDGSSICSGGGGLSRPTSFPELVTSSSKTPILKTFQNHAASVEKADSVNNPIYERWVLLTKFWQYCKIVKQSVFATGRMMTTCQ